MSDAGVPALMPGDEVVTEYGNHAQGVVLFIFRAKRGVRAVIEAEDGYLHVLKPSILRVVKPAEAMPSE